MGARNLWLGEGMAHLGKKGRLPLTNERQQILQHGHRDVRLFISCGDREENQGNGISGRVSGVSRAGQLEEAGIPRGEFGNAGRNFVGASGTDSGLVMLRLPSEAICSECRQRVRPVQYALHKPFHLLNRPMTGQTQLKGPHPSSEDLFKAKTPRSHLIKAPAGCGSCAAGGRDLVA